MTFHNTAAGIAIVFFVTAMLSRYIGSPDSLDLFQIASTWVIIALVAK